MVAAWLLVLLTLALPGGSVLAQPATPLQVYRSAHYRVFTDLSRAEAEGYGRHMDLVHRSYERFLRRLRGDAGAPQALYLLKDRASYLRTLAFFGIDGSASGGMFFYGPRGSGLATWVGDRPRGEVLRTLQHEGFHQFARLKAGDGLPIWVNEGLAEYFGDAVLVEGGVRHGIVDADRLQRLRTARDAGATLPLAVLLGLDPERWRLNLTSGSPRGPLQYDQAWSAVQFLIHGDPRVEEAFSDYLVALSEGVPHEEAFPSAFGSDPRPMQAAYLRYLAALRPDPFGEALADLRFLAEGVRFLRDRDGRVPGDMGGLEAALRASRFRVTTRSHGAERAVSALDPGNYRYLGEDGRTHRFVLGPAAAPGRPPEIRADALRPPARIEWVPDGRGGLVPELAFE